MNNYGPISNKATTSNLVILIIGRLHNIFVVFTVLLLTTNISLALGFDVNKNVPKDEESFFKIEDDKIRANCNFRNVCE